MSVCSLNMKILFALLLACWGLSPLLAAPTWFAARLLGSPNVVRTDEDHLRVAPRYPKHEASARPLLVKTAADTATYFGMSDENTNGVPTEVKGEPIRTLNGIRYLQVDYGVRRIPAGLFYYSSDLETVQFDGPVQVIDHRAFADSPKLNCVILYEARYTEIAGDAFTGCAGDLTCFYPFSPTVTALNGSLQHGGYLWSRIAYRGGPCRNRQLFITDDWLWSEEGDKALLLKYLGKEEDPQLPATLNDRKTTIDL